jgi:hypothetical protein
MAVNEAAMRRRAQIMRGVNVPMRAALSLPFATPINARHGFCIVRWHLTQQG